MKRAERRQVDEQKKRSDKVTRQRKGDSETAKMLCSEALTNKPKMKELEHSNKHRISDNLHDDTRQEIHICAISLLGAGAK